MDKPVPKVKTGTRFKFNAHKDGRLENTGILEPFVEGHVAKGKRVDWKKTCEQLSALTESHRKEIQRLEGLVTSRDWDIIQQKQRAIKAEHEVLALTATRDQSTGTIVRHRVAFQILNHHWTRWFLPRQVRRHMQDECI